MNSSASVIVCSNAGGPAQLGQQRLVAGASGNFELNVAKPVIACNLLQSIRLLAEVSERFPARVIAGVEVNRAQVQRNVNGAIITATAPNPVLGYDAVAQITKRALMDSTTPR